MNASTTKPALLPFKKTNIIVEVISDKDWHWENLEDIAASITTGDCSGEVHEVNTLFMGRLETANALIAQGSDPAFLLGEEYTLDLDENGVIRQVAEKAITGSFIRQAWAGPREDHAMEISTVAFNATQAVLNLPLPEIRRLQDHDYSTDAIGLEHVDHEGPFEVEIIEAILAYFDISTLDDLTQTKLDTAKLAIQG